MRAVFSAHARLSTVPELQTLRITDQTLRNILQYVLNWSYRCATRSAQKLPENWEILCEQQHARLVYTIRMRRVRHPALIVNADQAGEGIMPTGKRTWAVRGSKQVDTYGHGDKRQVWGLSIDLPLPHMSHSSPWLLLPHATAGCCHSKVYGAAQRQTVCHLQLRIVGRKRTSSDLPMHTAISGTGALVRLQRRCVMTCNDAQ